MFRFMPLENANAVLVITPQPRYLDQIQQWLDRIDSAGGGVRLFSYELKYIKAKDLADRLSEVFGGGRGQGVIPTPRWHRARKPACLAAHWVIATAAWAAAPA